ncbi:MAG: hypothetical protein ACLQJR_11635 [Stellaceae bacterium]
MSAVAFARLAELFAPLAYLLAAGGDTRLHLDPASQLNGYGCRPFPRPEAFTFASSTATSISERAYEAAEAAREALVRAALGDGLEAAVEARVEALRGGLLDLLGLAGSGTEIVFSPSGTDSALHAVFLARARLGSPIASVIAASDETGSGVAYASCGRHFSTLTAQGAAVEKGSPIAGLAEDVASLAIPLREAGRVRPPAEIDAAVVAAVAEAVAAGSGVLLHVMDHSKLGARCPSHACLAEIRGRFGERVQLVIDACQLRLSRQRLAAHLAQGDMVMITGSKFFTGPPFSGALLVPASLSRRLGSGQGLPAGLADYTSRSDWPRAWTGLRDSLAEHANLGQLLRWTAALREMRDYFAVPEGFRRAALARFAEIVPGLIASEETLELLPDGERRGGDADEEMAVRTIFPFLVRRAGRALGVADCVILYRALNTDVSVLLPADASARQRRLAAQLCHIGQPVALTLPTGAAVAALRISAGARVVSESWSAAGEAASFALLEREFDQVRLLLAKLGLLLRHFDAIARAFAPAKEAAA